MKTDPGTKALNALIVDDEQDACMNLRKTLTEYIDNPVNVVGIVQSTAEAEYLIQELTPDVIFLDIEMPQESAFDFLERVAPHTFLVIFVTAYDEYAIRAFKLNAVDYILKPISIDEVSTAVEKAKQRIAYRQFTEGAGAYHNLHNEIQAHAKLERIKLKDSQGFYIVNFKDIIYIEAKGSYSCVYFLKDSRTEKNIITSTSLNEYEELLPDEMFCRIHRSYLVNCTYIKKVQADESSFVVISDSTKLPVSRRRIADLMAFFKR